MNFTDLNLDKQLLDALQQRGYQAPTPIQQKAIPPILEGRDVLASAQTGTGKTAAFVLPLLQKLLQRPNNHGRHPLKALILTPTRELAIQVGAFIESYAALTPLRIAVIYGGVSIGAQTKKLAQGVDIVVATPGRFLDHAQSDHMHFSKVDYLVLDEADRMLDMGFSKDIHAIIALLPKKRQTVLFSATYTKVIKQLAQVVLKNPLPIDISPKNQTAQNIDQQIVLVDEKRKLELLSFLIGSRNWQQVLVFTRTKIEANKVAKNLALDGLKSAVIHGDKTQAARIKALEGFKTGIVRVLVATDVASRGIDIISLPFVINFSLPDVPEDYVHRIGRTGRAGSAGVAVTLLDGAEIGRMNEIEKLIKIKIPRIKLEGYEPKAKPKQYPKKGLNMDGKQRFKEGKAIKEKKIVRPKHEAKTSKRSAKK